MKLIKYSFLAFIIPIVISCNNNDSTTAENEGSETHTEHPKDSAQSPYKVMMDKSMKQMMQMKMNNDPDHDFASMMKMHHESAIEMAQYELQNGQDSTIREMAQTMITEQKKEIAEFDNFLSSNKPVANNEDASNDLMKAMHKHMEPAEPLNNNPDHDFVAMMITHHKSAVEMSESILKSGKDKSIKTMANKIIADQKEEINQLQNWLSGHK